MTTNLRAQTLTRPTNKLAADVSDNWREACREDPELFFYEGATQQAAAKTVCRSCPALNLCAIWALKAMPEFGVAGGMTPAERRAVKRRG